MFERDVVKCLRMFARFVRMSAPLYKYPTCLELSKCHECPNVANVRMSESSECPNVPMPERPAKCVSERHVDIVGYSIGPPHVKMLANAANESRCCHECGTTLSQMLRNIQTVPNVQMSEWSECPNVRMSEMSKCPNVRMSKCHIKCPNVRIRSKCPDALNVQMSRRC